MFKKTANEFASKLKELQRKSSIKAPEPKIQERPIQQYNLQSSYLNRISSQEQTKLPAMTKPNTTPNALVQIKKTEDYSLAQKPTAETNTSTLPRNIRSVK